MSASELYEDDGLSRGHEKGQFRRLKFQLECSAELIVVTLLVRLWAPFRVPLDYTAKLL